MRLYLAQVATHPSYVDVFGAMPTRTAIMGGQKCNYISQEYALDKHRNYCSIIEREREDETILCGQSSNQERATPSNWGGWKDLLVLESFYYARKNKYFPILYERGVDLLLDSGAFTYMQQGSGSVDWDVYIEDYAAFINKYNIQKFFELDIDSIIGLKEVERLRAKLERLTGKQSIPVWHISRGKEYFLQMVKNYNYVAFGGLLTDGVPTVKLEKAFPWFINEAHKAGCKLHGLGYSPCNIIQKPFRFDSVDSTSWIAGNRFGSIYRFNHKTGCMEKNDKPQGKRVKNLETAWNNFNEWFKFQQYLKTI